MKRKIAYATAGLAAIVVIGAALGDGPAPGAESGPIESDVVAAQPNDASPTGTPSESGARETAATGSERTIDSIESGPAAENPVDDVAATEGPVQDVSPDTGATSAEAPSDSGTTPTTTAAPAPTPTTTVPPTTATTTAPEIPPVEVDPNEIDGLLSDIEQLLAGLDDAMQQGEDLP